MRYVCTVAETRENNIHVGIGISEDEFVTMRKTRDASLETPALLLPSIQINMYAGRPPPPEGNGTRYFKIPIDAF